MKSLVLGFPGNSPRSATLLTVVLGMALSSTSGAAAPSSQLARLLRMGSRDAKSTLHASADPLPTLPLSADRVALTATTRARAKLTTGPTFAPTARMHSRRTMWVADNTSTAAANAGKLSDENLGPRQTQELTLKDDLAPGPASKFHFRLRSYNAMDLDAAEGASGTHVDGTPVDRELRAFERIDLRYNLTTPISFAVMPQFSHTWFGAPDRTQDSTKNGLDQSYSFYLGNTALIVNDDEILKLGEFSLNGFLRYDIPTSEQSQKDESNGETRVKLGLARKFGKLGLELGSTLRNYFQRYTSSRLIVSDGSAKGLPVQNMNYRIETVLDSSLDIQSWLSLFFEIGVRSDMNYADNSTHRAAVGSNSLILNPELDFTVSKNLSFALGIFEVPNYSSVDQQKYAPLSADPQNGNEAYVQATVEF